VLQHKAALLYRKYKLTGNTRYIQASVNTYIAAINTANFIKRTFDNDESRLFFTENFSSIYHKAMAAAYELYTAEPGSANAEKCLLITENYKGSILYHNLQNIELRNKAGLPQAIMQQEKEIKQLIAFYTNRLNNNETPGDAGKLRERLLEKQVELSRIQKQYEQDPEYSFLKYNSGTNSLTISAIQRWLDDETVLFHYMVDGDNLYAAVVNKDDYAVKKLKVSSSFSSQVTAFVNEIYQHAEGRRYQGADEGARLYKLLIQPFSSLAANKKRWVILPDGMLNYIPFDALVKDGTENRYVVQDHIVAFHYSFSLLAHESAAKSMADKGAGSIIFAPFATGDKRTADAGIAALPFSAEELKVPADRKKTGRFANKQQFLYAANQSSLIHLATHAQAGDNSAGDNWILFYPSDTVVTNNRLYLHEIYNIDLARTNLVVLSACETAAGKSITGEGLQSFSRAFLYAGSRGVVSTLWKTADEVSAWLMQRMHHHLEKGKAADEALQLAKNDLLASNQAGTQYKTPNYWSNFIYTGKLTPRKKETGIYYYVIAALLCAGVVVLQYSKHKRKS
jgi:CHAT domain-containing protein